MATSHALLSEIEKEGFAIVPGIIGQETIAILRREIEAAIVGNGPRVGGRSGYALRHLSQIVPAVRALAEDPAIGALTKVILGPEPFVVRSLFFDKTTEANWKVTWHQDLTIAVQNKIEVAGFNSWSVKDGVIHVQPPVSILERILAVRIHLDDCGGDNGALQVLPGSHLVGRLDAKQISNWRKKVEPTTCTVPAGGTMLMRPLLLHASSPALNPKHRRVIHLEFAANPLPSGLKWALQPLITDY